MLFRKSSPTNLSKEFAMARSVHPYFVPGAAQGASADRLPTNRPKNRLDSSRSLAGMLLAAVVAALMVVADQLIDTWADGHLLVVWVGLWTVAFTALALLAPPLRQLTDSAARMLTRWSKARAQDRSDSAIWAVAQQDYRVMRDLQVASIRGEYES
jgi:hypothetical protein